MNLVCGRQDFGFYYLRMQGSLLPNLLVIPLRITSSRCRRLNDRHVLEKKPETDSARKRSRQRAVSKYNRSRIGIGLHIDRWMDLKSTLKLQITHADVAA